MTKLEESRSRFLFRSAVCLAALGVALLLGQLLLRVPLRDSSRTNRLLTLASRQADLNARLRPEGAWSPAREQCYRELQRSRDEWAEIASEPCWALQDWMQELRSWRQGDLSAGAAEAWKSYGAELSRRQSQLSRQASVELENLQEMQRSWMLSVLLILALQLIFVLRPAPKRKSERPATQVRLLANLEAAARVQRSLLPSSAPCVPGLSFAWQYHPCEKVAGDMYGIQVLDERHVACYVLDVSGHGIPAALLSVSLSRSLSDVEGLLRRGRCSDVALPSEVVSELNRRFPVMSQSDQFITMCYGVLDLDDKTFTYVRAGHPGPVVCRSQGPWVPDEEEESSPPVGILDEVEFRDEVLYLEAGDRVLLYTDGITEATDAEGRMFGSERLLEALEEHRHNDLQTTLSALLGRVERFSSRTDMRDDLTVLAFELAGAADPLVVPGETPAATRFGRRPDFQHNLLGRRPPEKSCHGSIRLGS